jgi:hypothetical protein
MKRFLIATTALALFAAPAQAQLLGGGGGLGGLGGSLGGAAGGALGGAGSIGSVGTPGGGIDSVTRGTLEGTGNARGSARADRHSGRVDADGQGNGSLTGDLTSATGATNANGRASGSASGSGSASAQLVGTDAVRSTAQSAVGQARSTAQQARGTAQGLVGTAGGVAGSASGSASGTASGAGAFAGGPLTAAGSLASQADGAFAIERGTPIFAPDGDRIGRVQQVVSDARGNVQQVLVKVDGERATLPANYFQANGSGLVSVIGEGQIKQIADQQEDAQEADANTARHGGQMRDNSRD